MSTATNFLVFFPPRLGGMFTPCSLSSRLTDSLRIPPGLPAPLLPFPPACSTYFPIVFPLASPVVLGSCQTPATLWEAGPPIPKPNKWEKENKKNQVQAHVDTQKTLPLQKPWSPQLLSETAGGTVLTWHFGPQRRKLLPIFPSASQRYMCAPPPGTSSQIRFAAG